MRTACACVLALEVVASASDVGCFANCVRSQQVEINDARRPAGACLDRGTVCEPVNDDLVPWARHRIRCQSRAGPSRVISGPPSSCSRPSSRPASGSVLRASSEEYRRSTLETSGLVWPGGCFRKKALAKVAWRRKLILQAIGVVELPDLPTHDENDACISAVLAAAADGKVTGVTVSGLGLPLAIEEGGTMREGQMVIPEISGEVQRRIEKALREVPHVVATKRRSSGKSASVEAISERATGLRDCFIKRAREGSAQICTYAWAYRYLFDASYAKWSQAFANQVVSVAESTPRAELTGLGAVRLDAFIVAGKTGLPSGGHWESADYDREDWERVLGTATLLN